eukprot:915888_1
MKLLQIQVLLHTLFISEQSKGNGDVWNTLGCVVQINDFYEVNGSYSGNGHRGGLPKLMSYIESIDTICPHKTLALSGDIWSPSLWSVLTHHNDEKDRGYHMVESLRPLVHIVDEFVITLGNHDFDYKIKFQGEIHFTANSIR